MSKAKIDIEHVAKLASLKLSVEQQRKLEKQLTEILSYIGQLEEVNTKNIEPIGQITGLENVTRDDQSAPSLSQETALKNAPRFYNGYFEVDAVFTENSPE